jgi:LPXTG-motif cell wall-anchored protein
VRQLALLTGVYALAAALALPGSLAASDDPAPPEPGQGEAAQADVPAAPGSHASPEAPPAGEAPADAAAPAGHEAPAAVQAPPAAEQPAGDQPTPVSPQPAAQESAATPAPAPTAQAGEQQPEPADARARGFADRDRGDQRGTRRPVATAAASTSVTIEDFAFSPSSVTIDVGDTVTWTNRDPTQHSATAEDGSFDTGLLRRGQSGLHTFEEAGTFPYVCTPHPGMKGTITVRAASSGDSGARQGESGTTAGSVAGSESGATLGSSGGSTSSGAGTTGTGSDTGSTLPATGADPTTLAVLGLLFLALGAAVQSRVRREHDS